MLSEVGRLVDVEVLQLLNIVDVNDGLTEKDTSRQVWQSRNIQLLLHDLRPVRQASTLLLHGLVQVHNVREVREAIREADTLRDQFLVGTVASPRLVKSVCNKQQNRI